MKFKINIQSSKQLEKQANYLLKKKTKIKEKKKKPNNIKQFHLLKETREIYKKFYEKIKE